MLAAPVTDEDSARQSVAELSRNDPDLLLIITLRGLSAQIVETACLTSHIPCLICPVQGNFALPSSALARGALRQANRPVEMLYPSADHEGLAERLEPILRAARAFTRLGKTRIGMVGGLYPNLVSCRYDPQIVSSRLGVSLFHIPFDALRTLIQTSAGSIELLDTLSAGALESNKVKSSDRNALQQGLRLHQALTHIAREQGLTALPRNAGRHFHANSA